MKSQKWSQPQQRQQKRLSKKKDPKKVAAGKRLAEHNIIIRQALNKELKKESEKEAEFGDISS